eukprot:gene15619-18385_t
MTIIPFDDRDGWIWMDGHFVPWRDAKVHVLTHGLHYGSCVFEGERLYNGKIFKLTEHTRRLFRSAEILEMEIPFTVEEIDAASGSGKRTMMLPLSIKAAIELRRQSAGSSSPSASGAKSAGSPAVRAVTPGRMTQVSTAPSRNKL